MFANLLKCSTAMEPLPLNGYLLNSERFAITQLHKQLVWGAISQNDHWFIKMHEEEGSSTCQDRIWKHFLSLVWVIFPYILKILIYFFNCLICNCQSFEPHSSSVGAPLSGLPTVTFTKEEEIVRLRSQPNRTAPWLTWKRTEFPCF